MSCLDCYQFIPQAIGGVGAFDDQPLDRLSVDFARDINVWSDSVSST